MARMHFELQAASLRLACLHLLFWAVQLKFDWLGQLEPMQLPFFCSLARPPKTAQGRSPDCGEHPTKPLTRPAAGWYSRKPSQTSVSLIGSRRADDDAGIDKQHSLRKLGPIGSGLAWRVERATAPVAFWAIMRTTSRIGPLWRVGVTMVWESGPMQSIICSSDTASASHHRRAVASQNCHP